MKFLVVLASAVACALAQPGLLAPGVTAYHGLGPIAPVAAAPLAAPIAAPVAAPIVHSKYHVQNEIGQASYGHAEPFQTHNAVQDGAGNKLGSFSYVSPEGIVFKTDYVADALGYRVASNALPVDTPAVVAARSAHLAAHAAALHRIRRQIVAPLAIGHTPAATAPLGHPAPLAAPIATPLAAPVALGHTPAATAPLGHPITAPFAAHLF